MNTTPPHAHRPTPGDEDAFPNPLAEHPINDLLLSAATTLMLATAAAPRDRLTLVNRARGELDSLALRLGAL